jgi:hypothetical protein
MSVTATTADDPRAAEAQKLAAKIFNLCQGHKDILVFEAVLNLLLMMARAADDGCKTSLFSVIKQAVALAENETDAPGVH